MTEDNKVVAKKYLIPIALRLDVQKASCEEIFSAVASLISIYTEDLLFAEDKTALSPYDVFLRKNNLPDKPEVSEPELAYSKRLLALIKDIKKKNKLQFVSENPNTKDGGFRFHNQPFTFGEQQLTGMEVFFNQEAHDESAKGNCIACHAAPHFTDFGLHNTGITQVEYDAIHGTGTFNQLPIPNLNARNQHPDRYLPATHQHPNRTSLFRAIPSKGAPNATDLGAWNVLHNDDYPNSQQRIRNLICNRSSPSCRSDDHALKRSIATFKTPGLRNLGHSAPYMHNGQISGLHAVMNFYISTSANARLGLLSA